MLDDFDDFGDDDFENPDDFLFEGLDENLPSGGAVGHSSTQNSVISMQDREMSKQLKNVLGSTVQPTGVDEEDVTLDDVPVKMLPKTCLPKVANVVGSVDVGCPIPLKLISHRVKNTEYNPKRFSATTMRIRNPKATANIFANGKIVVTGAQSEDTCRLALRKFVRIVAKAGVPEATFQEFKVHNVVAHCNVGFPVKLEALALKYQGSCTYEPELFPGVIWKTPKPTSVCVIIYVSGEMIFTGGKTRQHVYKTFEMLYPKLLQFIKLSHKDRVLKSIQEAQNASRMEGISAEHAIELD